MGLDIMANKEKRNAGPFFLDTPTAFGALVEEMRRNHERAKFIAESPPIKWSDEKENNYGK